MPNGMLMPAEITLVRVEYKGDYFLAGYTNDLREIKNLKEKAAAIYYDPLTDIYNRRYLYESLKQIMKSLSRYSGKLSLLMIDIDCFKQYNDTYGHAEGDNCLKAAAEVITKSITRADDFAARYGGEEFTVVLPNTDENGARNIAERLLENIRKRNILHETSMVTNRVTFSIGITTGDVEYGQNSEDYIKHADRALYQSKQAGRDRCTFIPARIRHSVLLD
jgi:diguanylate cyclase (GGDEF)-like protein